ncbi:hypothetical protein PHSY_006231 [Pseudozyma hubeiensis SY62]|uniref:CUE domain-containing protein n=1 Tax=Pseudozyma hubeiensis (strain SY62) TaxID=1305764 RepID=R9PBL9_PSEHS|nr:hypothetical protein PHSY_006231 [Pseudozyma hubeiensis SY62]GAC98637.1 hypothetical protein PHSY_006231 [Pseudozyma hubeiensis SY62]
MGVFDGQNSQQLVQSLAKLPTSDLVRFTLQKPDVARIFASSLHLLAIEAASDPLPVSKETQNASGHVDILARLIERGDPSLARKFVPTQGSLVDLAVAAPEGARTAVASILERLLDATSVKEIVGGLSLQFSGLVSEGAKQDAAAFSSTVRTLARLSNAFLAVCPPRLLKGNLSLIQTWARTSIDIYDKTLPQLAKSLANDATHILSEPDLASLDVEIWQLHWLTCRVDLLQLISTLLSYLTGSSKLVDALRESLADTEKLLNKGGFSTLLNSTILLDLAASSDSWPSLRSELASAVSSKKGSGSDAIASIDTLATSVPKFTGAAWDALQRFMASQIAPSSTDTSSASKTGSGEGDSEEVLASVDSVLPHYGMDRLRTILSRPSFAGQSAEMVIQRLLEGDEGEAEAPASSRMPPSAPAVPQAVAAQQATPPPAIAAETPLPSSSAAAPSPVKSRALFGDFAFDPASIVQPKLARSGRVDELAPELKAAILARAEAADDDEAEEEWNPFAEGQRTVGVEDELDLDNDGRERAPHRSTGEDGDSDGHEGAEESRKRERLLLRYYVQNGSGCFSADAATRRSEVRRRLREQTGWGDDLIESWAVMLDRNPKKDRLLAAASQSELEEQMAERDSRNATDADDDEAGRGDVRRFGPDRGRGGRILRGGGRGGGGASSGRGGGHAGGSNQGGGAQTNKATRGRGTGNSGTDRSAKQKEKAGNKARQRGHDKKMARVNPS